MDVLSDISNRIANDDEFTVYTVFPATGLIIENEVPNYSLSANEGTVYWEYDDESEPDWGVLAPGIEHYEYVSAEDLPTLIAPIIQRNAPFWIQGVQIDAVTGEGDDTE